MIKKFRLNFILFSIILGIFAAFPATGSELKESWQRDLDYEEKMHITELIRSLNVPYQQRKHVVEKLVAIGMGINKNIVEDQLINALDFDNMQIRMAVIEIMVKIGNSHKFISSIGNILTYEPFADVRIKAIRNMSAFMIPGYKERRKALDILDAEVFNITEDLKVVMRQPPMKRSGAELDPKKTRTRIGLITVLAAQLDPIGTAIRGLRIKNKQLATKDLLEYLTGDKYEGNIKEIIDRWLRIRASAELKNKSFVISVQEETCNMLAAIGGIEAWKELFELSKVQREESKLAAAKAFSELTEFAQKTWQEDQGILRGAFLSPDDIYNWHDFSNALVSHRDITKNNFSSLIWNYLSTEAKLAINSIAKDSETKEAEISFMKKKSICDSINFSFGKSELLMQLNPGNLDHTATSKDDEKIAAKKSTEFKYEEISHLNRLFFEKEFKYNVRKHTSWHRIAEEEKIWRLERQQNCKNLISKALVFGTNILNSGKSSPSLRKYGYKILGHCRNSKVIHLLYDWAVRKETNRSLLTDICEALGEIGGTEGVKALAQLASYKGYSSSVAHLQREYRSVFTAFTALGTIAKRPADPGGKLATLELTTHLNDKRSIPGLPSIKKQALWQLRYSFQEGRRNLSPEEWLLTREEYLKRKNENKRVSVEF
ncbi:MAG: hypothetical protein ACYTFY_07035 [Planctomycetota bacterium]